jgi:transcriptional regulator with XRE-family HTH domain
MRTVEETIEFCKERIAALGMSQADVLAKAGCSTTLFIMSLKRKSYMRVETMASLAKILNVSVADILGVDNEDIPDDIQNMVSMLKEIPPRDRKMIAMNIENYYRVSMDKKKKS